MLFVPVPAPGTLARLYLPSETPSPNHGGVKASFALGRKEPVALGPLPLAPLGHDWQQRCLLAGIPPSAAACLVLVPKRNELHVMAPEIKQAPRCQDTLPGQKERSWKSELRLRAGCSGLCQGKTWLHAGA